MKNLASLLITICSLVLITSATVLYSEGWRVGSTSKNNNLIHKTGMIAVRSIPNGAKVYVNDVLTTATDDTIASLVPGDYKIKVEHEGFESWEKTLTVYPELVTDITAVLVLQSPKLEPLTNADVKAFSLSSNQNNIAFLTKNHTEPGIWLLPLTGSPLNLFKNSTKLLISDNDVFSPSSGEKIWWSYDDKEVLVQMNTNGYLLYQLSNLQSTKANPISITDVNTVFKKWDEAWKSNFLTHKIEDIKSSKDQIIPAWIIDRLESEKSTWSPDDKKFYFINKNTTDKKANIVIYNSESPLPIGEKRLYDSIEIADIANTKVQWYSDSYHLILLEKAESADKNNVYTISLVRIDGTNKTPIYTGELASNQAYATASGDKIVVLTSLKENSQTNLYAIAIR